MGIIASKRAGRLALAAGTAAAILAASVPGRAAEPFGTGAIVSSGDPATSRRLDLSIGRSVVIDLPRDAKEVFVANPAIANAIVRSARKIFLIGMANGVTSVFMMDQQGGQIAALEVNVGRDLNVLRQTLRTAIPGGRIEVKPAGDSILLVGAVASAGDAQQAVDIAKAFVGQSNAGQGNATGAAGAGGGGTQVGGAGQSGGGASGNVINALTINGRDQVMLKVSVVEIARTAVKQLGINVTGNWNLLSTATAGAALNAFAPQFTAPAQVATGIIGGLTSGGSAISGQAGFGNGNAGVGGTLSALERAGVSRTLAEPTLVAISGETASFQAGGEIPIVINSCAAGICTPSVSYKPYGVLLRFTPVVLSEGRISLRVATEVSEIDRDNQDLVTRSPGFRTRKSDTTIELPSGASMVTAGLISSQSNQTINGVPGLINLPILGALFRSRDFQRRDSELMIMVTPFIAKPMEAAQVARPDDGFVDATDPQTVLLGRLNKLYGTSGGVGAKGYSGRFGFITD